MKKLLVIILALIMLLSISATAFAAMKPALPAQANARAKENYQNMLTRHEERHVSNLKKNGVEFYQFYLSKDVMPSPPYGTADIIGSDISSKLLVNQPLNKNMAIAVGVMKGLKPNTAYTVHISKGYTTDTEVWNVLGWYTYQYTVGTTTYTHHLNITSQEGNIITGTGSHDGGTETVSGILIGNKLTLHVQYLSPSAYSFHATLVIDENGKFIGTATDGTLPAATITTVTGAAKKEVVKVITSTTYPGPLSSEIPPFTFITDDKGIGEWNVTISYDTLTFVNGKARFSVWINDSVTILISEDVILMK